VALVYPIKSTNGDGCIFKRREGINFTVHLHAAKITLQLF
jgi:hypothetical protein